MHPIVAHQIAADRVAQAHREAASARRAALALPARPWRRRARVVAGRLLIASGERLVGCRPARTGLHP